jgi:predicted amidohydrolase/ribosomal protein S18 acetylase RimI-like enzyme
MSENVLIEIRNLRIEDYISLKNSMIEAYPDLEDSYWTHPEIEKLLHIFPEGQIGVFVNGKVAGSALSLIVDYNKFGDDHNYMQITGNQTFSTHNAEGDVLYGIDIFVHPEYRNLRLGRRMYDARKDLCERLNLRAVIAGGRIPNYTSYADDLSPKGYINKVKLRQIYDPTLSFQLANDFHVKKVLRNYMPGDKSSHEFATLLQWHNIYYQKRQRLFSETKPVVRLGLVQWQMRSFANIDALLEQVEFFVDAISDYQCNFILFPEFFNAPLMAAFNHFSEAEAIRKLAQFTEPLRDKFIEFAISYNINIITGSMPLLDKKGLRNVGYLCRRDGTWEQYEKIHITPSESQYWGMVGGNKLKVFDTDSGKIGILICYDVEFPELARLLAEQEMQLLFVPFLTSTQNAYIRVRNCAMARAIENECYVAIAGCVGNLPKVNNMDIQYAQSAVFTPSDFAFPTNGIKSEATPNTEMTLIVDVDLDLLKELHSFGAVRNLKERRLDIYKVLNLTAEE